MKRREISERVEESREQGAGRALNQEAVMMRKQGWTADSKYCGKKVGQSELRTSEQGGRSTHSEEKSNGHKTSKIVGGSRAGKDGTPTVESRSQPSCGGEEAQKKETHQRVMQTARSLATGIRWTSQPIKGSLIMQAR